MRDLARLAFSVSGVASTIDIVSDGPRKFCARHDVKLQIMPSVLTPFEQAACAWLEKLEGTWNNIDWNPLPAKFEKAFFHLVRGGFIEAELPVEVRLREPPRHFMTVWRVTGDYTAALENLLRHQVRMHEGPHKGFGIVARAFTAARLTAEGELAKRDMSGDHEFQDPSRPRAGLPKPLFEIITGGPDGLNGVVASGEARLVSEDPIDAAHTGLHSARSANPLVVEIGPDSLGSVVEPLQAIEAAIRASVESVAPKSPQPFEPSAPAQERSTPTDTERWLSPGEQSVQLLGSPESDTRDHARRLQITGSIRRKALNAGFLRLSDVDVPKGKNVGQFVRESAWALPAAYFRAIRVAARTDEATSKVFPSSDAGKGREWLHCERCVKLFAEAGANGGCPKCGSEVRPLVRARA